MRRPALLAAIAALLLAAIFPRGAAATTSPAQREFEAALSALVAGPGLPRGAIAAVKASGNEIVTAVGFSDVAAGRKAGGWDTVRIASVSKAFSGAASLAKVKANRLSLSSTVGSVLRPLNLTSKWRAVTLGQLLQHTSGIYDFSRTPAFVQALIPTLNSPRHPPPRTLVSYAEPYPLNFPPGSRFQYSNTDNILAALMVAQVYGHPYEVALAELITRPLGLSKTLIPPGNLLPSPHMRGYDLESNGTLDDVTTLFAAGWSWSSGGVASTVPEVAAFFRAYVSGKFATPAARRAQFRFVPGNSEPPGPGTNAAGMALFRYVVPCRGRGNVTVYGHTGNTPGYTAFAAASADGRRSAAVSIGAQITATTNAARFPALREVFRLAVCAAMA